MSQPGVEWISDNYRLVNSELRKNKNYMGYITANSLVMGVLPMLILAVLNWLIFRAVTSARARHVTLVSMSNSSSHRRDSTMSTLLSSIVLIFVTCHTPKAILNMYEVYEQIINKSKNGGDKIEDPALDIMINISHLLIVTNSAFNIVVYFLKDFKFRAVFWSLCSGSSGSRNSCQLVQMSNRDKTANIKQETDIKIHFLGKPECQDPGALSTNTQMMELTNLPSPDAEDKKLLQTDL